MARSTCLPTQDDDDEDSTHSAMVHNVSAGPIINIMKTIA